MSEFKDSVVKKAFTVVVEVDYSDCRNAAERVITDNRTQDTLNMAAACLAEDRFFSFDRPEIKHSITEQQLKDYVNAMAFLRLKRHVGRLLTFLSYHVAETNKPFYKILVEAVNVMHNGVKDFNLGTDYSETVSRLFLNQQETKFKEMFELCDITGCYNSADRKADKNLCDACYKKEIDDLASDDTDDTDDDDYDFEESKLSLEEQIFGTKQPDDNAV